MAPGESSSNTLSASSTGARLTAEADVNGLSTYIGVATLKSTFRSRYAAVPTNEQVQQLPGALHEARLQSKDHEIPEKSYHRPSWIIAWAWELVALLFSVLCMVAVIVVAFSTSNKPLSAWTLPTSPTALISLCTTFAKSAMLLALSGGVSQLKWIYFRQGEHSLMDFETFDEASRGPFGSILLLLRVNRNALLACTGALLTIRALAMDPFAQQVLMYSDRLTPAQDGIATTWRADSFELNVDERVRAPEEAGRLEGMNRAIYQGLYSSDVAAAFECGTGSCSWPQFASFGLCNTYTNVTDTVKKTCSRMPYVDPSNYTTEFVQCRHETPGGASLWATFTAFVSNDPELHVGIPSQPRSRSCLRYTSA